MAEYANRKERKEAVRKYESARIRAEKKASRAEQRRKELRKKIKSTKGEIKDAGNKAARKKLKSQLEHQRQRRSRAKIKQGKAENRAEKATKKRDDAANWSVTKAGTPGVKNDVIQPFMTQDQIMELGAKQQDQNDQFSQLDFALKNMIAETEYANHQADEVAVADRKYVNEDATARGMFNSSIRDAALFDVDATAMALKTDNQRKLDAMDQDTMRQKLLSNQAMTAYKNALNEAMVKNAQDANEGMEEYKVNPTGPTTVNKSLKIPKIKPRGNNQNGDKGHGGKGNNGSRGPRDTGRGALSGRGAPSNNPGGGPTGPRPNVHGGNGNNGRPGPPRNNPTQGRPNP